MRSGIIGVVLFLLPVSGLAQMNGFRGFPAGEKAPAGGYAPGFFRTVPLQTGGRTFILQASGKPSPVKAALLSLLLPGAGQWYAGSEWKAAAFLTAEVGMWLGRSHFNGEGDRIKTAFRAYADNNWNKNDYLVWLNGLSPEERNKLSHTLPGSKTQQYYEMIGKYEQFLAGWHDSAGPPVESPMRLNYMAQQNDSNEQYKHAELLAQLMILNRVASAVEVVLSIHRNNARIQPGMYWRLDPGRTAVMPVAYVTITW